MDELIQHLNELADRTTDDLEGVVKSANASPERRIAALLLLVAVSGSPLAATATELITTLTCPDWAEQDAEPTDTQVGRKISERVNDSVPELQTLSSNAASPLFDRAVAQLILRAIRSDFTENESLDFTLKATTGRDSVWWIEWISEHRDRGIG